VLSSTFTSASFAAAFDDDPHVLGDRQRLLFRVLAANRDYVVSVLGRVDGLIIAGMLGPSARIMPMCFMSSDIFMKMLDPTGISCNFLL
jgi:hypothetical protein